MIQRILGIWDTGVLQHPEGISSGLKALAYSGYQQVKISRNAIQLGCTATQPRLYQDESLVVLLDGTLFNSESLPFAECEATQIALLYRQVGFQKMLEKINGDFALSVYDQNQAKLWLARDRFGIRPLYYYYQKSKAFIFASQPSGILAIPGVSRTPDSRYVAIMAASHYRYFDNQPNRSAFSEINQLPAAHWLCFDGENIQIGVYWELKEEIEWEDDFSLLSESYKDLLIDSVMRRLKRTTNPAFTLSGGMDSSSVLSCAVKGSQKKQIAYSSVYTDQTYDESEDIQTILSQTVKHWRPVLIEPGDVLGLIREMIVCHQEPIATATWLSHYIVTQIAHSHGISALFGGLGGDELNIGEYEYFFYYFADLYNKDPSLWKSEVGHWAHHHDHPLYRKNEEVANNSFRRLADTNGHNKVDRERLERYSCLLKPDFFDLTTYQPNLYHPFSSHLKNRTWQDIFYETMPCCLRAQDRHGARWNVEHFNPFLDYRLAEFMFRVPAQFKVQDGVTKILLREAMKDIVPDSTRSRVKKTGWNAPAHLWFSGEITEILIDLIHSQRFRQRGIYNISALETVILEHNEIVTHKIEKENHMMLLWQLVNLELWFQYLEKL